MATLARIWNRGLAADFGGAHTQNSNRERYLLRPLPNERLQVIVKTIDNARVVRERDPKAGASCVKGIGAACLATIVLLGLTVPRANSYLAGYTLTELEGQNQTLAADLALLAAREGVLTGPEHLAAAADRQHFLEAAGSEMVVLNNGRAGTVAMNAHPTEKQ